MPLKDYTTNHYGNVILRAKNICSRIAYVLKRIDERQNFGLDELNSILNRNGVRFGHAVECIVQYTYTDELDVIISSPDMRHRYIYLLMTFTKKASFVIDSISNELVACGGRFVSREYKGKEVNAAILSMVDSFLQAEEIFFSRLIL